MVGPTATVPAAWPATPRTSSDDRGGRDDIAAFEDKVGTTLLRRSLTRRTETRRSDL
jgi:hypothetical protein